MKHYILFCLFAASLLFACKEPARTTSADQSSDTTSVAAEKEKPKAGLLTMYRWKMVELAGKPVGDSVNGQLPAIAFHASDSSMGGRVGCNRFGGKYLADELTIRFSRVFATKMACQDMWVENTFLGLIDSVDRYAVSEKELILASGTKKMAVFEARPLEKEDTK